MAGRLRNHVSGPLAPFTAGFAAELGAQGYTPNSVRQQLRLMAHLSQWLEGERLKLPFDDAAVDRFLIARRRAGYVNYRTAKAMRPLLNYLRCLDVIPASSAPPPSGPVESLLDAYRRYLMHERGVRFTTAQGYVDAVRPFLGARLGSSGLPLDLTGLRATDVTAFVVARCARQSRGSAKLTVVALRSLLKYLHVEGLIPRSLSDAVPAIAHWRLAGLPKALEPDQVERLLSVCDGRTGKGRRDLAVLSLLARLGLRAGEVAALRLDDIDWRAGEIVVHGKGNHTERLPLPTDVGAALAAYLRHGRPHGYHGRSVFLRSRAPLGPLAAAGVTALVTTAGRRAGLGRIGAHRLRHTVATQMLRAGVPLNEIGQVLRHRCALTTAMYAKVDREALRIIARTWPGGAV